MRTPLAGTTAILAATLAHAPLGSAAIASPIPVTSPVAEIPFELLGDHIVLEATVNGVAGRLILDTGSSVSSLDAEWAQSAAGVAARGAGRAQGSADVQISIGQAASIRVGPLEMRDVNVALVPLGPVSRAHGSYVRGTLGFDFIRKYVMEIDYPARRLRLYEPVGYEYGGHGVQVPVTLDLRIPMVRATVTPSGAAPISARLLLDLGSGGLAVRLSAPFVAEHDLLAVTGGITAPIGTGVGGTMVGRIARLGALDVGGLHVSQPTVGLAERREGFFGSTMSDGTVGAPVFRRTKMILDYARSRVIFEAAPGFDAPYEVEMSGMRLGATPGQPVTVDYVIAASPAERAGVAAGDTLLAVDGRPARSGDLERIREMFRVDGKQVRLSLRRGTAPREVTLTTRRML
ncbi:MAG TPA: aspartyl protease family protein [Longimicrobium sp.]